MSFPKPNDITLNSEWDGVRPPYYMTPQGLLLPREMQPPPMFGPRGATVPPRFMSKYDNRRGNYHHNHQPQTHLYCESCDGDFYTAEDLEHHKSKHIKCEIEGCPFVGDPATISKHSDLIHKNGLFEKFKNLNTPEAVEKWRTERKRKYPTPGNIELRQKIQEEKLHRGERITEPKSRFAKKSNCDDNRRGGRGGSKFDRGRGRGRGRGCGNNKFDRSNNVHHLTNEKQSPLVIEASLIPSEEEQQETKGQLNMFKGTAAMSGYVVKVCKPEVVNPLAGLLGMYGSDDSNESSEDDEVIPIIDKLPVIATPVEPQESKESKEFYEESLIIVTPNEILSPTSKSIDEVKPESDLSSGEEPEELSIAKVPNPDELIIAETALKLEQSSNNKNRKRKQKNKDRPHVNNRNIIIKEKNLLNYTKLRTTTKSYTLLSKLLEPNIRHERNILLQCVRHVVKNSFFGIGQPKTVPCAPESLFGLNEPQPKSPIIELIENQKEEVTAMECEEESACSSTDEQLTTSDNHLAIPSSNINEIINSETKLEF